MLLLKCEVIGQLEGIDNSRTQRAFISFLILLLRYRLRVDADNHSKKNVDPRLVFVFLFLIYVLLPIL